MPPVRPVGTPAGHTPAGYPKRTVIVAGATARTGPAVLRAFLVAGHDVTAITRHLPRLRTLLEALPGGGAVHAVEADLLDPAQAGRVAAAVERFGRVDAMTRLAQATG